LVLEYGWHGSGPEGDMPAVTSMNTANDNHYQFNYHKTYELPGLAKWMKMMEG